MDQVFFNYIFKYLIWTSFESQQELTVLFTVIYYIGWNCFSSIISHDCNIKGDIPIK
jgi:hypothetical protein